MQPLPAWNLPDCPRSAVTTRLQGTGHTQAAPLACPGCLGTLAYMNQAVPGMTRTLLLISSFNKASVCVHVQVHLQQQHVAPVSLGHTRQDQV